MRARDRLRGDPRVVVLRLLQYVAIDLSAERVLRVGEAVIRKQLLLYTQATSSDTVARSALSVHWRASSAARVERLRPHLRRLLHRNELHPRDSKQASATQNSKLHGRQARGTWRRQWLCRCAAGVRAL